MNKKVVFFLFLATILLVLAGCQKGGDDSSMVFYYSLTCPHCKNVEKYIADNDVHAKVQFVEKEVSENKDNAAEFGDKVLKCGIKPEEAGVPLFWDGATCITGDQPIINFFFTKINEK